VIVAEELSDVILVEHSFGGNPVSVVADRMPQLLKRLIYIDTLLLRDGESGFSQLDPAIVNDRIELAEKTSGGLTIPPPSPEAFGVTDPSDAEWLKRRLTPLPLNCYQVPIRLKHSVGNGVSKTYIACTNPVYQPAVRTHEWVKSQAGWRWLRLRRKKFFICPSIIAWAISEEIRPHIPGKPRLCQAYDGQWSDRRPGS
jgi:hypothetical protein